MKTVIKYLATIFLSITIAANATEEVTSEGQAMSLCKAQAMTVNDDFLRSKSNRIKQTRSGYLIKLKVYLSDKSITSVCDIKRDGTLSYSEE